MRGSLFRERGNETVKIIVEGSRDAIERGTKGPFGRCRSKKTLDASIVRLVAINVVTAEIARFNRWRISWATDNDLV